MTLNEAGLRMTSTQSLFRSVFEMNGTASRKRGWLVFGVCTLATAAINTLRAPAGHIWAQILQGTGDDCLKTQARETLLNGRSYKVLNISDSAAADTTAPRTIPPGHLDFVGDNRDTSFASRFAPAIGGLGLVPFENVAGPVARPVARIVFSSAGASLLDVGTWRAGRYWRAVE